MRVPEQTIGCSRGLKLLPGVKGGIISLPRRQAETAKMKADSSFTADRWKSFLQGLEGCWCEEYLLPQPCVSCVYVGTSQLKVNVC